MFIDEQISIHHSVVDLGILVELSRKKNHCLVEFWRTFLKLLGEHGDACGQVADAREFFSIGNNSQK